MKKSNLRKKTVLVTGCGTGIGLALVKKLVVSGKFRVVITAREAALEELKRNFGKSEDFIIERLDITNSSDIRSVVEKVIVKFGTIDVLVNNAGICYRGVVEHMDEASELDQIRTNYLGPMELVRKVLPLMREQKSGCIINISSVSGIMAMPTMASYSASKFALEAATEALWYETRHHGIRVHLVEPGFVHSNSYRNVKVSRKAKLSADLHGPHSEYYHRLGPFIEKLMKFAIVSPDRIADRILIIMNMRFGALRIPVTFDAHLFSILRKILPEVFFSYFILWLLPGRVSPAPRTRLFPDPGTGITEGV